MSSSDQPPEPGNVVDPAVLAERRARRAELAEQSLQERTTAAERAVVALQGRVTETEERLAEAASERAELARRLAERERVLRGALQREYAEQRQRLEAEGELAATDRTAREELARLRRALQAAEARAAQIERDLEDAQDQVREARADRVRLAEAQEESRRAKAALAAERAAREHAMRELRAERERANAELAGLREALLARESAARDVRSQVQRLEVEMRDLRERAQAAAGTGGALVEAAADAARLRTELTGLEAERDQAVADAAAAREQLERRETALREELSLRETALREELARHDELLAARETALREELRHEANALAAREAALLDELACREAEAEALHAAVEAVRDSPAPEPEPALAGAEPGHDAAPLEAGPEAFAQEVEAVERAVGDLHERFTTPSASPPAPDTPDTAPAPGPAASSAELVDALVRIAGALRGRFETEVAAVEDRLRAEVAAEREARDGEIATMRDRLDELRDRLGALAADLHERLERESAARWAAEAELEQERGARVADRVAARDAIRAREVLEGQLAERRAGEERAREALAALREELDRATATPPQQISAESGEPTPTPVLPPVLRASPPPAGLTATPIEPVDGLISGLERAAERLRAQAEQAAKEPAAPAPPAAPPSSRPPAPEPVVPAALPAPRGGAWLARALVALHAEEPETARRLAVALLPVLARRISRAGSYDIVIEGGEAFRVRTGSGSEGVAPLGEAPVPGADLRVSGTVPALAPLLAGGASRRLEGIHAEGGRLRLWGALRAMRKPVGLAEAAKAGAALDTGLVLAALTCSIDPGWTRGHNFTVAFAVPGAAEAAWHVRVADGAPVVALPGSPPEGPTATLQAPAGALPTLLGSGPRAAEPVVTGNPHAVTLLGDWMERAQGLGG